MTSTKHWYKDAIFYELHVKSFYDKNGDGIGDFAGLTEKLDYLQDLGVDCLWLLPFYPSPFNDDGYDIANYFGVHRDYGTLRTFQTFLRNAHQRGIRVIADLVVNHTSDRHPWFRRARRAGTNSVWRNFYVWSDTPEKYREARVIFNDLEPSNWSWDREARAYYWHRFFSSQPDLNYKNPRVRKEMLKVVFHWLDLGLDGFRVDAVPYLFEREGTNGENLPETHAFMRSLRREVDARYGGSKLLLAEANQMPHDVCAYFGKGDEFHMAFNFPVMPRIFMALKTEDRGPIVNVITETPPIPEACQWALFLRNHDELTLEMISAEERRFMWREYARDPRMRLNLGIRRRLAPLVENNRACIELLNCLLFTLPGSPIIYYGDEIGMGDNIQLDDRTGVRTPMQWSPDRNGGFSACRGNHLYCPVVEDPVYGYQAVNVEAQLCNPSSLLQWMQRLIHVRKHYPVFGRGDLEFLHPANRRVLAYSRTYEDQVVLVVCNLTRSSQPVELDLSRYRGAVPTEIIGDTAFPPIGELPYFLSLGPYGYYWFRLEGRAR